MPPGSIPTTSATGSLWLDGSEPAGYRRLEVDREFDVAVLGGGIAGLTAALLLKRDGARVAVVESGRVGRGVTGCTTAKVSALQATMYSTIRRHHGSEACAVYGEASRAAVELVATLAGEESIECELERRAAVTYAALERERAAVAGEAEAAGEAGLDVSLDDEAGLPHPTFGAVRLDDQIQFHPVRYCEGLAAAVDGGGSSVFERTRALGVDDGAPCVVRTPLATLSARQVVVATHYPILDRGLYFARLEAQRSYCVAASVRGDVPAREMSISAGSPTRSTRSRGDVLIVGGEGHSAGSSRAQPKRFVRLEEFARAHWDVERVTHRWSAQDPVPYDHLPVIGPYLPRSSRLFVASGFSKWGLTSATFAAIILRDLIGARDNAWAPRFSPSRLSPRSTPKIAKLGARFAAELVGERLRPAQQGATAEVPRGEARIVRDGLGKAGVYRDDEGELHAVSLRCTHLGCLLRFNSAERSWDCPCHGSRFDVDGGVLQGPAVTPLERRHVGAPGSSQSSRFGDRRGASAPPP